MEGKNIINSHCDENGKWNFDGSCEKLTCPLLSEYLSKMYECTEGNKYGSVCTTTCLKTRVGILIFPLKISISMKARISCDD